MSIQNFKFYSSVLYSDIKPFTEIFICRIVRFIIVDNNIKPTVLTMSRYILLPINSCLWFNNRIINYFSWCGISMKLYILQELLGELMYLWYKKKSVSWKEMTFESFNA